MNSQTSTASGPVKRTPAWGRRLVIAWLVCAVTFALGFFIYAPFALPFVQKARVPGASVQLQQMGMIVLGVGGVLGLIILLGLLGVVVCGIGWYRSQRQAMLEGPAAT